MKNLLTPTATITALALAWCTPVFAWNSAKVQYDANGHLTYPSDANGNRIPDYSHAGYKGGGVALPVSVPVRVTLSPVAGDNTANIQAALDLVGAMPLQSDGYRGTVLLTAGIYEIDGTLRIRQSGVVLSGVGDGAAPATATILQRSGTSQEDIILAGGGIDDEFKSEIANTRRPITTPRVNVGSSTVTVDTAVGFAVGDNVVVYHPSTAAWIAAMNQGGVTDANVWNPGEIDIRYHRYITAISGNTIALDTPIFNHLEKSLSQSFLYKYNRSGVLTNIGIQNLLVDIVTAGPESEDHAENAIEFVGAENSWIRDSTAQHFWHAGVQFVSSTRCTVERCKAIEPNSVVTGERRYNFSTYHAQEIFFKDCFTSYSRHAFVANGTSSDSGNVVLNATVDHNLTFAEAHRRWSTGLLFDGIVTTNRDSGDAYGFYNRGNYGTGHGWAAGHSVIWRTDAAGGRILVQQPPTAQNYAIGCFGNVTGVGPWAGPAGYIEGTGVAGLQPQSLYLEQLAQRQASIAAIDLTPPSTPVLSSGTNTDTSVALSWSASTDNVAVDGYDVFSNGAFVGATASTTFNVTGLAASTVYAFTVRAKDATGNVSAASNAVSLTTAGPPPVAQPITFESEDLAYAPVGSGVTIQTETTSSGGLFPSNFKYVQFNSDNNPLPPGEYIEFPLTNIPAGTYNILMRYKSHPTNRGIIQLAVDGVNLGSQLNERSTPATFPTNDFGVVRFATAGNHVIRLTVMGRDATATQYTVTSDSFTLNPDTVAPVISAIANVTAEATGPSGAVVTYSASALDAKDGAVAVTFSPTSGSAFPLGSTTVTATAKDSAGNAATTIFKVNVLDTKPPLLALPANLVVAATSPNGAIVNFAATANDLVSGSTGVSFNFDSGALFPVGVTTVTATATDDAENTSAGSFTVTVNPFVAAGYSSWSSDYGLTAANNSPSADPDADGIVNLLEYFLGLNPKVSDPTGLPVGHVEDGNFVFRFNRAKAVSGVSYLVTTSTDLVTWTPLIPVLESSTSTLETYVAKIPVTTTRQFVRLEITSDKTTVSTVPVGFIKVTLGDLTLLSVGRQSGVRPARFDRSFVIDGGALVGTFHCDSISQPPTTPTFNRSALGFPAATKINFLRSVFL